MDNQLNIKCQKLANVYSLVNLRIKQLSKTYNVPLDVLNDRINRYI